MKIEFEIPDEVIQDMKVGHPFSDELVIEIITVNSLQKIDADYSKTCPLVKKWISEQHLETRALKSFQEAISNVDVDKLTQEAK